MGPDERVIGTHVTSRDTVRVIKFKPDPPRKVKRSRQCLIIKCSQTRMGPDERVIDTHVTSRDATRVDK
ncbi:hypothetical protein MA16_Dca003727 [Dendrobium catenatum]|uniref:Uncharacterized protein n=1 Tax=Dendrobium catenatum TaxID=906689 RepID=A0A2I0WFS2_9ASPA|nr:hypothetical protein MA16_Dca003727 [Dendrobium catenatum]